jgi:hypothetical protein
MVDVRGMQERFPEFKETDFFQLKRALESADRLVSDSWDVLRDDVVYLTACHTIAISPVGRAANLTAKDGSSTYSTRISELAIAHACARSRIV